MCKAPAFPCGGVHAITDDEFCYFAESSMGI